MPRSTDPITALMRRPVAVDLHLVRFRPPLERGICLAQDILAQIIDAVEEMHKLVRRQRDRRVGHIQLAHRVLIARHQPDERVSDHSLCPRELVPEGLPETRHLGLVADSPCNDTRA